MDVVWNQALSLQRLRVLFVDHEDTHDAFIKEMFAHFSCEVTIVRLASIALTMLSSGNCPFDLLMENVESPDSLGIQLLHDATLMGLPVILMTDSIDPLTVVRGMEEGAIFCVQRPVSLESVKYAWQHVVREKVRRIRENERVREWMAYYEALNMGTRQEHDNGQHVNVEQSYKSVKSARTRRNLNNEAESSVQNQNVRRGRKEHWIEWTPELHDRFVNAIQALGEGRCYPKEILEKMNVPGLRRMQVASHLQKCRSGTCNYSAGEDHDTDNNEARDETPFTRPRRFGTMPRIVNHREHNSNVRDNIPNNLVEDPTINPNVQGNVTNNLVEDPNAHMSIQNDNHGQNSQVHTNQHESIGHAPFGNMDFGGMENGDLSIHDMMMSDDLPLFDDQGGMDTDFNLVELLNDLGFNGELFAGQVPTTQEQPTDLFNQGALN